MYSQRKVKNWWLPVPNLPIGCSLGLKKAQNDEKGSKLAGINEEFAHKPRAQSKLNPALVGPMANSFVSHLK
jgi:hypothetical protein